MRELDTVFLDYDQGSVGCLALHNADSAGNSDDAQRDRVLLDIVGAVSARFRTVSTGTLGEPAENQSFERLERSPAQPGIHRSVQIRQKVVAKTAVTRAKIRVSRCQYERVAGGLAASPVLNEWWLDLARYRRPADREMFDIWLRKSDVDDIERANKFFRGKYRTKQAEEITT